jgi:lysophospholipase L1-like esterase
MLFLVLDGILLEIRASWAFNRWHRDFAQSPRYPRIEGVPTMKAGGCIPIVRRTVALVCGLSLLGSIASETLAQRGGRGSGRGGGRGLAQPLGQGSAPAAVPEVVAIERPTEAEIEQARQLLAKLKSSDAAAKALLEKWPELIVVQPPRENTAIVPSLARFFEAKHNANLEVAKAGDIDVLFMGDSITDFWRNEDGPFVGKPVFDKYFGGVKVANFGIAGDTTQGVLYRLQNGEGEGFTPKAVMLMIGTNNTGRNSAAEIAEGIGAVVLELRKRFPDAKILLLGVFPRSAADAPVRETIKEINATIARLHDDAHVFYLDIGDKFLDADGNIPPDVMSDALHPSTKGYEIWAEAVKEPLAKLVGVESLAAE